MTMQPWIVRNVAMQMQLQEAYTANDGNTSATRNDNDELKQYESQ